MQVSRCHAGPIDARENLTQPVTAIAEGSITSNPFRLKTWQTYVFNDTRDDEAQTIESKRSRKRALNERKTESRSVLVAVSVSEAFVESCLGGAVLVRNFRLVQDILQN